VRDIHYTTNMYVYIYKCVHIHTTQLRRVVEGGREGGGMRGKEGGRRGEREGGKEGGRE